MFHKNRKKTVKNKLFDKNEGKMIRIQCFFSLSLSKIVVPLLVPFGLIFIIVDGMQYDAVAILVVEVVDKAA